MNLPVTLTFYPHTETPKPSADGDVHVPALLYSPCQGFELAYALLHEDGSFSGFFDWLMKVEYEPDTFYVAWAMLPSGVDVMRPVFAKDRP